jgi:hypothetical protein
MKPFARFALYFVAGLLASALFLSTLSVYAFDQYEPAWGRGGSVQVEWWVSSGVAICALFSVAIATGWLAPNRSVHSAAALASGVVFVLLTIAVFWLLGRLQVRGSRSFVLLWVFVAPAILGLAVARALGRETS